jgi:hypothetical protein
VEGLPRPRSCRDWLVEEAIGGHDGDLSAATRSVLLKSQIIDRIVSSPDPHAKLQVALEESEPETAREAYFDDFGRHPEDPAG